MGFDNDEGAEKTDVAETNETAKTPVDAEIHDEHEECENSVEATNEEEQEVQYYDEDRMIELVPQDDESLTTREEQLHGTVDLNSIEETVEADVKILELTIKSPGMRDIVLPVPQSGNPEGIWFSLKQGTRYSLNFIFQVCNKPVSGLKFNEVMWKCGAFTDNTTIVFGNFDPGYYTHDEIKVVTMQGFLARGQWFAKTKFLDDNDKCYRELNYSFKITI